MLSDELNKPNTDRLSQCNIPNRKGRENLCETLKTGTNTASCHRMTVFVPVLSLTLYSTSSFSLFHVENFSVRVLRVLWTILKSVLKFHRKCQSSYFLWTFNIDVFLYLLVLTVASIHISGKFYPSFWKIC